MYTRVFEESNESHSSHHVNDRFITGRIILKCCPHIEDYDTNQLFSAPPPPHAETGKSGENNLAPKLECSSFVQWWCSRESARIGAKVGRAENVRANTGLPANIPPSS